MNHKYSKWVIGEGCGELKLKYWNTRLAIGYRGKWTWKLRERVGWVEDWSPYGIDAESNVQIWGLLLPLYVDSLYNTFLFQWCCSCSLTLAASQSTWWSLSQACPLFIFLVLTVYLCSLTLSGSRHIKVRKVFKSQHTSIQVTTHSKRVLSLESSSLDRRKKGME